MSKIGQLPVEIPNGVTVEKDGKSLSISGPKGKLTLKTNDLVEIKVENNLLKVLSNGKSKFSVSIWGTTRKLISNMIKGVTDGWSKQLELVGTGYRAEVQGRTLVLTVGYSHPIKIEAPEGVNFKVEKNIVTVDGIDRQIVGQVSANIREARPPEPYKGKGIKYLNEVIRRKAGKAAKATA